MMKKNKIVVKKVNREERYRGKKSDRKYPIYPVKELNIFNIIIPDFINENSIKLFTSLQCRHYTKHNEFYGEILVQKEKNGQFVLIKGAPILFAAKQMNIEKLNVRIKKKFKQDQADEAAMKRLKNHQEAIDCVHSIYEKLQILREKIKRYDQDLYDLSDSVSDDLKEQIRIAHFNSLHSPYVYKYNEKIVIEKE